FVEDALAFLAIVRRRRLDFLEHGGGGRGELLTALQHFLHHFAHRLDLPGGGLGRELSDLGHVLSMADIFRDRRRRSSRWRDDRLDARGSLVNCLLDLTFNLTDIEGSRRCVLHSHRTRSFADSALRKLDVFGQPRIVRPYPSGLRGISTRQFRTSLKVMGAPLTPRAYPR